MRNILLSCWFVVVRGPGLLLVHVIFFSGRVVGFCITCFGEKGAERKGQWCWCVLAGLDCEKEAESEGKAG